MEKQNKKYKRKWGDRRDGRLIKVSGLSTIMMHLFPKRIESEVFLKDTLDVTDVLEFIDKKNKEHPEYRTTIFHCVIMAIVRMIYERPVMNRFVAGRRTYERYEISAGFVAKRRFADDAEESLLFFQPKETDSIDELSKMIVEKVEDVRKKGSDTGGIDKTVDSFAKIPRFLLMFVMKIVKLLDFLGKNPKALTDGDPNYSSVFLSNLGSIDCPAVYHHLNNYGTNSLMVTVGTMRKEEKLMPDGTKQVRTLLDVGATLDERIGDGFYFARSLKLLRYICAHPEILDRPINENSGYDYK